MNLSYIDKISDDDLNCLVYTWQSELEAVGQQTTTEVALDIIAFASLCIKHGFDESVANNRVFIEMVNEAGFRTARGEEFTYMGFRNMMRRLDDTVKAAALSELDANDITFDYAGYDEIETYEDAE